LIYGKKAISQIKAICEGLKKVLGAQKAKQIRITERKKMRKKSARVLS
jgi:hypothetical protein